MSEGSSAAAAPAAKKSATPGELPLELFDAFSTIRTIARTFVSFSLNSAPAGTALSLPPSLADVALPVALVFVWGNVLCFLFPSFLLETESIVILRFPKSCFWADAVRANLR